MKNKIFSIVFIVIVAVIFIGSIFLLFVTDPEITVVNSDDFRVTVEGFSRVNEPFSIEMLQPTGGSILLGPVYKIEPSGTVLDLPATVRFDLSNEGFPLDYFIYEFDSSLSMWEEVDPVISHSEESIQVRVQQLGKFTLGRPSDIQLPNFLTTFEELLSMAPKNTVGYEMAAAYKDSEGPLIKFNETTLIGGCGGIVHRGNTTEQSVLRRKTRIFVNDVETLAEIHFVANWFVSDLEGCQNGQILESF